MSVNQAPWPDSAANVTTQEYIGDIPALGGIQLTEYLNRLQELKSGDLSDIFPDRNIAEREIRFEQMFAGVPIMPLVNPGRPSSIASPETARVTEFRVRPAYFREDEYFDTYFINQLRTSMATNDLYTPEAYVAERVQKIFEKHQRTKEIFRVLCLLGGISYTDKRNNVSINAITNIPTRNLFRYDGWNATLSAGSTAAFGGASYTAASNLTNNKGRAEAIYFSDANLKFGVPWTHPQANIARSIRMLRNRNFRANKVAFNEIFMGPDLYTLLQDNEYIKSELGSTALFGNFASGQPRSVYTSGNSARQVDYRFGSEDDLVSIGGARIRVMQQQYRDPATGVVKQVWPSNKVVLASTQDPLGFTYHCVGEGPNQAIGLWSRTTDNVPPPNPPGGAIQIGDAFLPVAKYPYHISIIDVCDPADLSSLGLSADEFYGVY